MKSYERRTRTQVYQELAIEWPVNLADFEKLVGMARAAIVPGSERDDTFTILSTDEEIIIQWVSHERSEHADGSHDA